MRPNAISVRWTKLKGEKFTALFHHVRCDQAVLDIFLLVSTYARVSEALFQHGRHNWRRPKPSPHACWRRADCPTDKVP
jgi:hypothetical protein